MAFLDIRNSLARYASGPIFEMNTFSTDELAEVGVYAIRQTLHCIITEFEDDPANAVRETLDLRTNKKAIDIDIVAEHEFAKQLRHYHAGRYKSIEVTGEERISNEAHYQDRNGTFVLVDALDGSDLAERGLSNWCSAAVFFDPSRQKDKIRAAIVGMPPNHVYFATVDDPEVRVYRNLSNCYHIDQPPVEPEKVTGRPPERGLSNASLYFYGQKIANFIELAQRPLWDLINNKTFENLRIYNLGGIPMMVRMCDHKVKLARGVDAVIELRGQKPHDAVPGLFFAAKAGATILSLSADNFGAVITLPDLERLLFNPSKTTVKYLVAAHRELAHDLLTKLPLGLK